MSEPQYWLSINYIENWSNPACAPTTYPATLVRASLDLKVVYWGDGPQHMPMFPSNEAKVVKNYGLATDDFGRTEAELLYLQDHPPQASEPVELSYGWLSPEGEWFTCTYGGHSALADDLYLWRYQTEDYTYSYQEGLRAKGWIQVADAHIGSDLPATDQQKETLAKLLTATGEDDYKDGYKRAYENYFDIWAIKLRRESEKNAVHNRSDASVGAGITD